MVLTLTSTDPTLAGIDYIKYLTGSPVIKQSVNEPTTIDLDMAAWGSGFVLPRRGSYFVLGTDSDPTYWTGFVTNAPQLEYVGKYSPTDQPTWSWHFTGTDDSYILNLAPLGILPVYINQTQGAIIKDLANRIAPGKFDVTAVEDGQLVPYYFVDPTTTFGQIVKDFAAAAYYRFWTNDFKLYYERQDVTPATLIINGHSDQSSRVRIASSTGGTPIVVTTMTPHGRANGDCISISDHVLADGTKSAAVGNWFIESVGASNFTLTDSVGNGTGTATGWAGKHNPHFTPGRLSIGPITDPVINDAIVLGDVEPQGLMNEFWVGDGLTNAFPMASSVYGVDSALLLDDIFSGAAVDSNIWTEVDSVNNVIRVDNGYLNIIGNAADAYGVYLQSKALIPLQGNLRLTHGEFDFVTDSGSGIIASLWTSTPSSSMAGCVFGIQVVGTDLHPIINGVVQSDTYTVSTLADNKRYILRTLVTFQNINRHDREYLFRTITGTLGSFGGNTVADIPVYRTIITEIDATTGRPTTNQTIWTHAGSNTGVGAGQFFAAYVPVVSNNLHITLSNITISVPMQVSLSTVDKDLWYPERNKFDIGTGAPIEEDFTSITWTPKQVGPNEIDSYDGMGPVATIITSRQGRIDSGNILGSTLYNAGDATLTFFKDSTKLSANTPTPGQIMRLRYRRAGIAIGRAQNADLITSEAAVWGDNGLRTITKKDLSPLPRTSVECEMAAAALVAEGSYQHYAGTYEQFSTVEFTGVPRPGTILRFANLPAGLPVSQSEVITSVESLIDSKSKDIVKHTVTFGKIDQVKKFLASLKVPPNPFAPTDTAELPTAADLAEIIETTNALSLLFNSITLTLTYGGTSELLPATAIDVLVDLRLKAWTSVPSDTFVSGLTVDEDDPNYFVISIGQAPPVGGGFELRYADQGWGDANNTNYLVYDTITNGQTTASEFKIARRRETICFVRAYDAAGNYSRFSSGIRIVFPEIPGNPSSIVAKGGTIKHPVFKANLPITTAGTILLSSDVYGLVATFNNLLSLSSNVFTDSRGVGTAISPYIPIGVDNPGPYNITPTNDGFQYEGATVFLPGGATIFDSGFINFETEIPMQKGVSVFFIWIRAIDVTADDGLYVRLNIKDDAAPGESIQPYGFYSRQDYLLTGDWQPLATVVDLPRVPAAVSAATILNYNLVVHNINTVDLNLRVCLPFVGTSFYNHSDIVLGASEDGPGLNFTYDNVGETE